MEQEAAEEAERQRLEDERQRKLEEETIRLSELQRQAEEERLQQAILVIFFTLQIQFNIMFWINTF